MREEEGQAALWIREEFKGLNEEPLDKIWQLG